MCIQKCRNWVVFIVTLCCNDRSYESSLEDTYRSLVFTIDSFTLIILSDQSGNKHTLRSCSIAKSEIGDLCAMSDSVSKWPSGKGKVDFCATCETDLCNAASHQSFTIISVFAVPCFAIIISHWIGVWTNTMASPRHNSVYWGLYWIEVPATYKFKFWLFVWYV
jgi:hypothetical protein